MKRKCFFLLPIMFLILSFTSCNILIEDGSSADSLKLIHARFLDDETISVLYSGSLLGYSFKIEVSTASGFKKTDYSIQEHTVNPNNKVILLLNKKVSNGYKATITAVHPCLSSKIITVKYTDN